MGDLRRVARRGLVGWWKDVSIAMARRVVERAVAVKARRESCLYMLVWGVGRRSRILKSRTCGGSAV